MNPDGREDRKELGGRKGGETIYLDILCGKNIFSIRRYKKQKACINKTYTGFYHEYFETLPKNLKTFQINEDIKHINR